MSQDSLIKFRINYDTYSKFIRYSKSPIIINSQNRCKHSGYCEPCIEKYSQPCCYHRKEIFGPYYCVNERLCPNIESCPSFNIENFLKIDDSLNYQIENAKNLSLNQDNLNFDGFIPLVEKKNGHTTILIDEIKQLKIKTINVTPKGIFSQGDQNILLPSYQMDLHEKLNYENHIFFSWNTIDKLCHKMMDNINSTIEALKLLNIDSTTFPDANFYYTQPPFVIKQLLSKCYSYGLKLMELKIPIIPFYYPILPEYSEYQFRFLKNSGAKIIAVPWYEFNRYNIKLQIKEKIYQQLQKFRRENGIDYIFLNQTPTNKSKKIGTFFCNMSFRVFSKKEYLQRDEKSCQMKEIRKLAHFQQLCQRSNTKLNDYFW